MSFFKGVWKWSRAVFVSVVEACAGWATIKLKKIQKNRAQKHSRVFLRGTVARCRLGRGTREVSFDVGGIRFSTYMYASTCMRERDLMPAREIDEEMPYAGLISVDRVEHVGNGTSIVHLASCKGNETSPLLETHLLIQELRSHGA